MPEAKVYMAKPIPIIVRNIFKRLANKQAWYFPIRRYFPLKPRDFSLTFADYPFRNQEGKEGKG
jgi:hypothetical protein